MKWIAVVVAVGALAVGCGDDAESVDTSNPVSSDAGGEQGDESGGSDDGSGSTLGLVSKTLINSLNGAESFEITDGGVTFLFGSPADEAASIGHCQIAVTARNGVGESAPMTMKYPDRSVDCDELLE